MGLSSGFSRLISKGFDLASDVASTTKKASQSFVDDIVTASAKHGLNLDDIEDLAESQYNAYRGEKNKWKARKKADYSDTFGASTLIDAEDLLERGVVSAGKIAYKGAKGAGKFAFKTPVKNDSKFFGYEFGLNKRASIPLGVALATVPVGIALFQETERHKLGEIEGGLPSKTVNATFSPTVDRVVESANSSPIGQKNFGKKVLRNATQARLAGVDPDIVFALHTLRNDKDVLNSEVVR